MGYMEDLKQYYNQENKKDAGKLRWDLLPWQPIEGVVEVLTYGLKKYQEESWREVEVKRYWAALFRHLVAYQMGEEKDQESGISHLSHAMCNIIFIQYLMEMR